MESAAFFRLPRHRLTVLPRSSDLDTAQYWQLTDILYLPARSMVEGAIVVNLMAAIGYYGSHSAWYLAWGAIIILVTAARLWAARAYWRHKRAHALNDPAAPWHWARVFAIGGCTLGLAWGGGAAGILIFSRDPTITTLTVMVMPALVAAATTRNYASPVSTLAQVVGTLLPCAVGCIWAQNHVFRFAAPFALLQILATLNMARGMTEQIVAQLATEKRLAEANVQLQTLSSTDSLTRIANRRSFDDALRREWARAARDGTPVSLLMIDVDHFKLYNDHYGHIAGDKCLAQVAARIAGAILRPPDLAARFGGEEFCALLPGTDAAGASEVAERLRRAVADAAVPHIANADQVVTVSIGAACVHPKPGDDMEILLHNADQALYRAKNAGRNRVHPAPPLREAVA